MKKIKKLEVIVNATWTIEDVEISDEIFDILYSVKEYGTLINIPSMNINNEIKDQQGKNIIALDWIKKNLQSVTFDHRIKEILI